jgi:hypothetical protein
VAATGDLLVAADRYKGVYTIDASNRFRPAVLGFLRIPDQTLRITVGGDYAYAVNGLSGLYPDGVVVVDISEPVTPTTVARIGVPTVAGVASAVALDGQYAYIAVGLDGLQVVDVSVPTNPRQVSRYDTPGYARDVALFGHYAYVADGLQVRILDIADLSSIVEVGSIATEYGALGVVVAGQRLLLSAVARGVSVYDLSSPTGPTSLGRYEMPTDALAIAAAGSFAYIADSDGGLRVVDLSGPAPTEVGYYPAQRAITGVASDGRYTYVANGPLLVVEYLTNASFLPAIRR